MKKSSKLLITSVLVMSSLGLVATVFAKPFGEDCGRDGHQMGSDHKSGERGFNVDRMAKKLNLTDDQRTQIEGIVEGSKQQMREQREQMQASREQLRALMQQSLLNEAEVRRVADAQGDLEADMIVQRAQQRAKINTVLSDDQRAQLEEMRGKKRRDR